MAWPDENEGLPFGSLDEDCIHEEIAILLGRRHLLPISTLFKR